MSTRISIAVIVLCMIYASCSKDESNPPDPPPATTKASEYFMPLTTGNFTLLVGPTTTKLDTFPAMVSNDTTRYTVLAGTKTSAGGKSLRAIQTYNGSQSGSANTSVDYFYAGDTELTMFDSTLQETSADTYLKLPVQLNTPWKVSPQDTVLAVITSANETVATAAGTFTNCIKVTIHNSDATGFSATMDWYFAKGVGIVRMKVDAKMPIGSKALQINMDQTLRSKNF